jgi:hypothetical protein
MRRSRLITATLLVGAAMTVTATPAHAQLGKLKKLGTDAIKEAAKAKAGVQDPEPAKPAAAAAAVGKKADYTITASRLDALLASIEPLVAKAQKMEAAKKVQADYDAKRKTADACLERAGKMANPMAIAMNTDEKKMARMEAMQKQLEGVNKRSEAAMQRNDFRNAIALRDTSMVLTMTYTQATLGANCPYPYMPAAMIEAQVLEENEQMRDKERVERGENGEPLFEPSAAAKKEMSQEEFGMIRERVALYAMMQTDPGVAKGAGKAAKFTPDEQAVLSAKGDKVKQLAGLFASGSLTWASWGDLKKW